MKIISLHFENINSLAGEWTVRFDDAAFSRNHLFAISGPTGAGKTTVLDAVSLALYGKTPRQDSIADQTDKTKSSVGELVMTMGTGSAFSEVEFESGGSRYKAVWEVHRANNRQDGKLQGVKRKLLFEENGTFVAREEISRTKDIDSKIAEIIGLDFSQFTRAVMIPQGGFDKFLKGKREEKAAMLEKLSGQEIYRKLSVAVFNRKRTEQAEAERIRQELGSFVEGGKNQLLSESDERDFTAWVGNAEKSKAAKALEQKKYEEIERTLKDLADAEKDCQSLRTDVKRLEAENRELDASRKRLSRAEDAQKLVGPFEVLKKNRAEYQQKKDQKAALLKKIPELEEAFKLCDTDLKLKEAEEKRLREEDQKRNELRETVNGLDAQKEQSASRGKEKKTAWDASKGELEKCLTELRTLQTQKDDARKKQAEDEAYLNAHPTHKMLQSQCTAIADRLNLLKESKEDLEHSKNSLAKAKNGLSSAELESRSKKSALKVAKDERERALANDITKITVFLQTTIRDGDPCPVCGSTFHSTHPVQNVSEKEVSATASRLQNLQARYEKALQESETAEYDLKTAKRDLQTSENDLTDKKKAVSERIQNALDLLGSYGFSEPDLDNPAKVCGTVNAWAKQWEQHTRSLEECRNGQARLDVDEKHLTETEKKTRDEMKALEQELETERANLKSLDEKRKKLFGTVSVADDRNSWQKKIDEATTARTHCESKRRNAENTLTAQKSQLGTVSESLVGCERDKERSEVGFQAMLRENRFSSEDELQRSLIPEAVRVDIKKKIEKAASDLNMQSGRLKQAEERVEQLRHRELGRETLETARSKIETLGKEIESFEKQLIEKRKALDINAERKKSKAALEIQKSDQEAVTKVWETLNELIGSADGKKFVEYVQGLTLKKLIVEANRHLAYLDSRYQIQPGTESFDIRLYDAECGKERVMANLSGGETFLVSLSLALGLSSLASRHVRIETLFLDEGFGSLDDRMLQNAIELLRRLGESGDKLVGVISHIDRLKEEISNHIEVVKLGGGRSKLLGPGVSSGK